MQIVECTINDSSDYEYVYEVTHDEQALGLALAWSAAMAPRFAGARGLANS